MKEVIGKIIAFCLATIVILSASGCGKQPNEHEGVGETKPYLAVTEFNDSVLLVDESVARYLASDGSTLIGSVVSNGRYDYGVPVTIEYEVGNITDKTVKFAELRVAETQAELEDSSPIPFAEGESSVNVYNLYPNRHYVFSVSVKLSDDTEMTSFGEFDTKSGVRLIYAQDTVNVRDIGGWSTESGKKVKYGMVYRGGEMDGKRESDYKLTTEGILTMTETLGIRYDMDLRAPGGDTAEYGTLGENVPRKYYDLVYYQQFTSTYAGLDKLKEVFSDLAKPENYPIYIHCTYGADRTGTVLALLEALLGMSKSDIIREYELTYLYFNHVNRNYGNTSGHTFLKLLKSIEDADGNSFAEKAENILLKAGVTEAEINNIRSLLLV